MSEADSGKKPDPKWERVQDLFGRALDLPAAERRAFVEREANGDRALAQEVIELLACDAGSVTGPITNALGAAVDQTSRDRRRAMIGKVVGRYKLTSILGHGGTGTVYLAERADRQYSAQVAVKIVDSATLQGDMALRFRAERQILASLNHQNIARLLDAGETEEQQPYLVMEYVHGEPLDQYCDRHQLDIRERLRLFLEICGAVQYAHQNLVIHRDLKPANILVAADGTPKLLDFGIAKLLDAGDHAAVLALTRMNDRLLTPEYASPEQILGRPVTTASDVYALGVVLYELLTGLRPYAVPSSASQLELERSICINDPSRPSTAIRNAASVAEQSGNVALTAQNRRTTVEKLKRKLEGDLDAIVMRALRKEPERRYSSIEQFAADLRRYLGREPVQARQGNWIYYSQRFVRRHAFGVSAGAVFAVFLATFGVVMSIQAQRIAQERDRATIEGEQAKSVSEFMLDIFEASDPFETTGKQITARELLDEAGRNIRGNLNQHPEVRARLLEAIGRAYRRQNEFELSISFLEDAIHLRKKLREADPSKLAHLLSELAMSLKGAGDLDAAQNALREAIQITQQNRGERSATYATLLTNLGRVEQANGNTAAAIRYLMSSLALTEELFGSNNPEVASIHLDLAQSYLWNQNLAAAERAAREAVRIYSETVPDLYPDRVLANFTLGDILLANGNLGEASAIMEESLQARKILYGAESRQVGDVYGALSDIRIKQGLLGEAENLARESLRINARTLGPEHYTTGYGHARLANVLLKRAKSSEAEHNLRRSLEIYEKSLPPDHPYVASSEHLLGEALVHEKRFADAEAVLTAATNRLRRTNAKHWRIARSESALGEALYRQGRAAEAEKHLRESYELLSSDSSAERDARVQARERITRFYTERGERQKLEALLASIREPGVQAKTARN